MSDKKVLTINPELFTFSNNNNKSKKVKPKEPKQEKIRVKSTVNRKQDTLRKQSLLKMIRKHQEERYKRLFDNTKQNVTSSQVNSNTEKFNKEFDSAREYLDNLTKRNEMNIPKNTTLRQYPNVTNEPVLNTTVSTTPSITSNIQSSHNVIPQYGCLKNGNLPTYRNYMNKTQYNKPALHIGEVTPLINNIPITNNKSGISEINNIENKPANQNNIIDNKINEGLKRISELKQKQEILNKIKNGGKPKKMRRKKTLRRTYKIGRSQIAPKVSVLVSNKTLRNKVTTTSQLLKQTPIMDVKKYLIKHGIIRVGSTTPNDVLRKMYESMSLICGEVQNHNPDTLLYNYINGAD